MRIHTRLRDLLATHRPAALAVEDLFFGQDVRTAFAVAATPLHALVNYAYAILETEATIVLQAFGFDPSLGILHTDKRYRGSLAADLMEAGRPAADEIVLGLLETRELRRRV